MSRFRKNSIIELTLTVEDEFGKDEIRIWTIRTDTVGESGLNISNHGGELLINEIIHQIDHIQEEDAHLYPDYLHDYEKWY